jgi:hypothetical protein
VGHFFGFSIATTQHYGSAFERLLQRARLGLKDIDFLDRYFDETLILLWLLD